MARQLFLLSQPSLVVQGSFYSDSEHFLNRAKVNFEKSVYSSAPMNRYRKDKESRWKERKGKWKRKDRRRKSDLLELLALLELEKEK